MMACAIILIVYWLKCKETSKLENKIYKLNPIAIFAHFFFIIAYTVVCVVRFNITDIGEVELNPTNL